jgi:SAM-dependent methyltransferase
MTLTDRLKRALGAGTEPATGTASAAAEGRTAARQVEEAHWILYARGVSPIELRDEIRRFDRANPGELPTRLLASAEFKMLHDAWSSGDPTDVDPEAHERGLQSLGGDRDFVERAYEVILGRPVDEGGLQHFVGALAAGERRANMVRSLLRSEEFAQRYRAAVPLESFLPRDVQLCELANPAKWLNPDWMAFLRSLGLSDHLLAMHRKGYEFSQLLFGLERLGFLRPDIAVLSVGAGHEHPVYWLANRVRQVVATDLYEGVWQASGAEGDEQVVSTPADYAPFPYRADHLVFLKMDGRRLAFRDATFDVAYSLSSIEHFGKTGGALTTMDEMARVVKPGGLVAIATEYKLSGPAHEEVFDPEELRALLARPRLELVQPIDEAVYRRFEYVPIDLYGNRYQTPHMVVRFNDTVFTSVMAFLRRLP